MLLFALKSSRERVLGDEVSLAVYIWGFKCNISPWCISSSIYHRTCQDHVWVLLHPDIWWKRFRLMKIKVDFRTLRFLFFLHCDFYENKASTLKNVHYFFRQNTECCTVFFFNQHFLTFLFSVLIPMIFKFKSVKCMNTSNCIEPVQLIQSWYLMFYSLTKIFFPCSVINFGGNVFNCPDNFMEDIIKFFHFDFGVNITVNMLWSGQVFVRSTPITILPSI